MTKNPYGRLSELRVEAGVRDGVTVLEDAYFTAPFKLLTPRQGREGRAVITQIEVSAGLMAGDRQKLSIHIGSGAKVEWTSQSFEKIHRMDDGHFAERTCFIAVERGALLYYRPHPIIPFAGADFRGQVSIDLKDENAMLAYREIFCCGRAAMGERFAFRRYRSLLEITRAGRLIYRDNTDICPERNLPEGFGMFEGHTHTASLVLLGFEENLPRIREIIAEAARDEVIEAAASHLHYGGILVKALGNSAQELEELLCRVECGAMA
jgi:urease accessory protein